MSGPDARQQRQQALELSGWGEPVPRWQPRNLAWWVYLVLVVLGTHRFVVEVRGEVIGYGPVVLMAAALLLLYGTLFWWFTQHIDRFVRLPARLVVMAFAYGAVAATYAMAANANIHVLSLYGKWFGHTWAQDWGAGLTAPFTEELAKGSGLILLIAIAPRVVRTAYDGFILGAFIGLGFQVFEDLQYAAGAAASAYGDRPLAHALEITVMRSLDGVGGHILYSAIFCAGLVYLLGRPAQPRRVGLGLTLVIVPMVLHGIWDALGAIIGDTRDAGDLLVSFGAQALMVAVALVAVIRVFHLTVAGERDVVRAVLQPEVDNGVLGPDELDALAGDRKARKHFLASGSGHVDKRRRKHVIDAGRDLGDALAAARGGSSDRVTFARAELRRVRGGAPDHATRSAHSPASA